MDIPGVVKFKRVQAVRSKHQHQLLIHTYKCQQKKKELEQVNGQARRCHVKGCQKMMGVLNHMMSCAADKKCSWPTGCQSLRKMMRHYSQCTREYCPACTQKKEWQMSITEEQRSHITDLMSQMIPRSHSFIAPLFGMRDRSRFPDESNLLLRERVAYNFAKNRDDYFRTLAADKWKMEMEILEVERQNEEKLV